MLNILQAIRLHLNLNGLLVHLITKDYKLTKYAEVPGYGDLFDRNNDKAELNNLWEQEPKLRFEMLDILFHEYSITRSRFPIRDSGF